MKTRKFSTISMFSPAKINLCLHIVDQLDSGYHQLQTLFALLDWGDQVIIEPAPSNEITISGMDIPLESNLMHKASQLFFESVNDAIGLDIHIKKRIPIGAGLGGGSSNCASVLLGLNHLFDYPLSLDSIASIGKQLGADVPLFLFRRHAWGQGIGEQLFAVDLPDLYCLLAMPKAQVNTAQAFRLENLPRKHLALTQLPARMSYEDVTNSFKHNHFESIIRQHFPLINECFHIMEQVGHPRLSGTGATVFNIYESEAALMHAERTLAKYHPELATQSTRIITPSN